MGYKSARNGYRDANKFMKDFIDIKNAVVNNFDDMDFENADKKLLMQEQVSKVVEICDNAINRLGELTFEE